MDKWIDLKKILEVIESDYFYWGNHSRLKYLNIRIDTRDNHAVLFDRDDKEIDLEILKKGIGDYVIPKRDFSKLLEKTKEENDGMYKL